MNKISYQVYDEQNDCTHLEHPTDIAPMVGDIMNFSTIENIVYYKVVRRQFEKNTLIIILKKL